MREYEVTYRLARKGKENNNTNSKLLATPTSNLLIHQQHQPKPINHPKIAKLSELMELSPLEYMSKQKIAAEDISEKGETSSKHSNRCPSISDLHSLKESTPSTNNLRWLRSKHVSLLSFLDDFEEDSQAIDNIAHANR